MITQEKIEQALSEAFHCGHMSQRDGLVRWECGFTQPVEATVIKRNRSHNASHVRRALA